MPTTRSGKKVDQSLSVSQPRMAKIPDTTAAVPAATIAYVRMRMRMRMLHVIDAAGAVPSAAKGAGEW